jgi:hypothetical protein
MSMNPLARCPYCGQAVECIPFRDHPQYDDHIPYDDPNEGNKLVFAKHDRAEVNELAGPCIGGTAVRVP